MVIVSKIHKSVIMARANQYKSSLTSRLTDLSSGTEFNFYGSPQWNFLLGGGDLDVYIATEEEGNNHSNRSDEVIGSLLRVDLSPAVITDGGDGVISAAAAAGFGMMLVSPKARGKGVAKLLLNDAIHDDGERNGEIRKLLPVCTKAGQPVYEKLGFSNAGSVTSLSTTVRNIVDSAIAAPLSSSYEVLTYGSIMNNTGSCRSEGSSSSIDSTIRDLVIDMDKKATGYDRTKRLSFMLQNNKSGEDEGVQSVVATASAVEKNNDNDDNKAVVGTAVIRQEMRNGPYVIGPILSRRIDAVVPMIRSLVLSVATTTGNSSNDASSSMVTVLITDGHDELVHDLQCGAMKFNVNFTIPAMTLDGRSVYHNGDGSYVGIIHPTLG